MIDGLSLGLPLALPCSKRPIALLLDAGDTLIFFDGAAVAEVLAAHGVSAEPLRLERAMHEAKQRYQAFVREGGKHDDGWYVVLRGALAGAGVPPERIEGLLPVLRAAHDTFNFWRRVPEGLLDALDRARAAGMRLGVVSNSEGKLLDVLDRVGLTPRLDAVLDSHLEGVHKPDPEIFRRGLTRLGVWADQALFAGDIPDIDLGGAAAAGIPGVLVDPNDYYEGSSWPRVRSVAALCDALLELPP